jgi:hypothetical protein
LTIYTRELQSGRSGRAAYAGAKAAFNENNAHWLRDRGRGALMKREALYVARRHNQLPEAYGRSMRATIPAAALSTASGIELRPAAARAEWILKKLQRNPLWLELVVLQTSMMGISIALALWVFVSHFVAAIITCVLLVLEGVLVVASNMLSARPLFSALGGSAAVIVGFGGLAVALLGSISS